ncbi:DUF4124 domain-containing protein [Massilia sp. Se16.2.3]|nr:DUF4124 domain-containing protein [Massilia sp. Se16.2.3]
MTVLVLCAFGSGAAAQTVYKCTSDGKVSYGERPCAAGTTAVVPSPTPGDPAAAAARLARQKAVLEEVDKQEQVRLVRLEKEMRERLKMQRADAAARKKCEHLRLKQRWAREDQARTGGQAGQVLSLKARRQAEALAVECPG